jgi:peptide/nickel transport system substrate-binding protein
MTIWHADRTSDILFPTEPFWFVPMHRGWEECHWPLWSDWYRTAGKTGEEPLPEIRRLLQAWEEMTTSMDPDRRVVLGKEILRSQARNLWTIGTLGLAPQPVVVSHALRNVPERGWWGWDDRWTLPYHPETWFLRPAGEGGTR